MADGDHPRSRGEYSSSRSKVPYGAGSSPLSRGILFVDLANGNVDGIIPALAGNTWEDWIPRTPLWDHPRSRGEYYACSVARRLCVGIIPALAGNTHVRSFVISPVTDHPRSRGEYFTSEFRDVLRRGSSPLSRGIQHPPSGLRNRSRIIPALAGNTDRARQPIGRPPDHPRSRGEYVDGVDAGAGEFGSSPLSRGILCSGAQILSCGRIIPALAGNTARSTDLRAARRDHPRSRGEYCLAGLRISYPAGSSPLSRGIHAVLAAIKDC